MATYLKIQNGTKTKEYTLTSAYQKPYIRVSNSILPLTTRTTTGMHLKAQNGNTSYRPLEYVSTSQSASTSESSSVTYKTSKANSAGLSSTTALTRASTSQTVYDTRVSTSNTIYGTVTAGRYSYGRTRDYDKITRVYHISRTALEGQNGQVICYGSSLEYYESNDWMTTHNTTSRYNLGFTSYYGAMTFALTAVTATRTTGTTYQTRASTYQTRYLTRASTSGYSGVSSSSSSTSASSSSSTMTWD